MAMACKWNGQSQRRVWLGLWSHYPNTSLKSSPQKFNLSIVPLASSCSFVLLTHATSEWRRRRGKNHTSQSQKANTGPRCPSPVSFLEFPWIDRHAKRAWHAGHAMWPKRDIESNAIFWPIEHFVPAGRQAGYLRPFRNILSPVH